MLQVSKVVALTHALFVLTWNTSKLCFGEMNFSVCFAQNSAHCWLHLMISLFTFKRAFKSVCNKTWFFNWKYSFCHNIRKVQSFKGKYSVFFAINIQYFFCFQAWFSEYFENCLWTFAFVPTRKSNAAKLIARQDLEWRCF